MQTVPTAAKAIFSILWLYKRYELQPDAFTNHGTGFFPYRKQLLPDETIDFSAQRSQLDGMKYRVVIETDEDGVFVAECPALPGCISQGKTRAEALANIRDAMTGYLDSLKKHGEPLPPPISEEIVEIPA